MSGKTHIKHVGQSGI